MTVKELQTAINNDEEVEYMSVHYKAIGYQLMKRKGVKSQSAILQDLKNPNSYIHVDINKCEILE